MAAPASSNSGDPLVAAYIGIGFTLFAKSLPESAASYLPSLLSRNRILADRLFHAEEQLRKLRSRLRYEALSNARASEIFSTHHQAWLDEERRLLARLASAVDEASDLRARLEAAEAEAGGLRSRVEILEHELAAYRKEGEIGTSRVPEESTIKGIELDEISAAIYSQESGFCPDFFVPSQAATAGTTPWMDQSLNGWKNMKCEPLVSSYKPKHAMPRRESPWKNDMESSGVPGKLKLLDQELVNLEKAGKDAVSKVPSMLRKQAKRYHSLSGKINDLCQRMQISDPGDPTLIPEIRTQRQTEFLLEAFRLQNRAAEMRNKMDTLQLEAAKDGLSAATETTDDMTAECKASLWRSLDSIRTHFKEIQRILEIWLARISGDLEGMLARDGASRLRDYYLSPYPFAQ